MALLAAAFLVCKDVFRQLFTSCMDDGSGEGPWVQVETTLRNYLGLSFIHGLTVLERHSGTQGPFCAIKYYQKVVLCHC